MGKKNLAPRDLTGDLEAWRSCKVELKVWSELQNVTDMADISV